jgi:hypothetical protein
LLLLARVATLLLATLVALTWVEGHGEHWRI